MLILPASAGAQQTAGVTTLADGTDCDRPIGDASFNVGDRCANYVTLADGHQAAMVVRIIPLYSV